jgi:hypothetical protein
MMNSLELKGRGEEGWFDELPVLHQGSFMPWRCIHPHGLFNGVLPILL